ncbi:MAG: 30S ribosomal protein S6 [Elusimicrobiota bacterium]
MPTYETVFVIPSVLSEEEKNRSLEDVEKLIDKSGGKINKKEDMGERDLAYRIASYDRGFYHLIEFEGPADMIKTLKKHFRLNDKYIRNIIINNETSKI